MRTKKNDSSIPSIKDIFNCTPEKTPLEDLATRYAKILNAYINNSDKEYKNIEEVNNVIREVLQTSDDPELIDLAIKAHCKEYIREGINPIDKILLLILDNMPEHVFLQALALAKSKYNIQEHPAYSYILHQYQKKYNRPVRLPNKNKSNRKQEITL